MKTSMGGRLQGVPGRVVNRVDKLIQTFAFLVRQRPRAQVAATSVYAHFLRIRHSCETRFDLEVGKV
jgi:hypothetical protein